MYPIFPEPAASLWMMLRLDLDRIGKWRGNFERRHGSHTGTSNRSRWTPGNSSTGNTSWTKSKHSAKTINTIAFDWQKTIEKWSRLIKLLKLQFHNRWNINFSDRMVVLKSFRWTLSSHHDTGRSCSCLCYANKGRRLEKGIFLTKWHQEDFYHQMKHVFGAWFLD